MLDGDRGGCRVGSVEYGSSGRHGRVMIVITGRVVQVTALSLTLSLFKLLREVDGRGERRYGRGIVIEL